MFAYFCKFWYVFEPSIHDGPGYRIAVGFGIQAQSLLNSNGAVLDSEENIASVLQGF